MWELFKDEFSINSIEKAYILNYDENKEEKDLQCQLDFLLGVDSAQPGEFTSEINKLKGQIEFIDVEKYHSAGRHKKNTYTLKACTVLN